MVYMIIIFGSLSGLSVPAIQGMISRTVGDDQQGEIQGALTSLQSVAGFVGPPVATGIFGFFVSEQTPVIIPGAPFFFSAVLVCIAAYLASKSFQKTRYRVLRDSETD
jgi:DHA1 family tetracycline resistance protein-like MFS transporter